MKLENAYKTNGKPTFPDGSQTGARREPPKTLIKTLIKPMQNQQKLDGSQTGAEQERVGSEQTGARREPDGSGGRFIL